MYQAMRYFSISGLVFLGLALLSLLVLDFGPSLLVGSTTLTVVFFVFVGQEIVCVWTSIVLALIDSARARRWKWFRTIIFWGGPFTILNYVNTFEEGR